MRLSRFIVLFPLAAFSLYAKGQQVCLDVCPAQKTECRKEAERAAQSDAVIPFWAKADKAAQSVPQQNAPADHASTQIKEDGYRTRRSKSLAMCEEKYQICLVSCRLNNFRDAPRQ
ncbi:hypothetical protein RY831_28180 [Noviherbaspirillum sp. CPCC 100848]|uniref:Uncharacterized protein n=1 Tax=Noviherbaspirillum album TaxID=3080276 RepID=A0ABU6JHM2_9BURK|nr:hypothetical protein [Noviherbaspirillum sp. CPCC 100848]MEC4723043.1 hypothetical protein [Noviherbaspirillum sp. CPCC 100848]